MSLPMSPTSPRLLILGQHALGMTQEKLGKLLGVSRRTILRWQQGPTVLTEHQRKLLITRVYAVNPSLAAEIAKEIDVTLESVGAVPPPALVGAATAAGDTLLEARVASRHLADSVVCAAAEAVGLSPQAIRPALVAAFARAAAVGLSVRGMSDGLKAATLSE
jgi:DNA-binding XRE family transcriptional regulator